MGFYKNATVTELMKQEELIKEEELIKQEAGNAEFQKVFNLPPSKIFKVFKPSSKCCKVGLSKLKIIMNLENESTFQKEGMIFGIDHHLNFFYVS